MTTETDIPGFTRSFTRFTLIKEIELHARFTHFTLIKNRAGHSFTQYFTQLHAPQLHGLLHAALHAASRKTRNRRSQLHARFTRSFTLPLPLKGEEGEHSPNGTPDTNPREAPMSTFDPTLSPRLAPAWNTALGYLADGHWHPWTNVVTATTDIKPVTASNLLHDGTRNGTFERHGDHSTGNRQIRLTGRAL